MTAETNTQNLTRKQRKLQKRLLSLSTRLTTIKTTLEINPPELSTSRRKLDQNAVREYFDVIMLLFAAYAKAENEEQKAPLSDLFSSHFFQDAFRIFYTAWQGDEELTAAKKLQADLQDSVRKNIDKSIETINTKLSAQEEERTCFQSYFRKNHSVIYATQASSAIAHHETKKHTRAKKAGKVLALFYAIGCGVSVYSPVGKILGASKKIASAIALTITATANWLIYKNLVPSYFVNMFAKGEFFEGYLRYYDKEGKSQKLPKKYMFFPLILSLTVGLAFFALTITSSLGIAIGLIFGIPTFFSTVASSMKDMVLLFVSQKKRAPDTKPSYDKKILNFLSTFLRWFGLGLPLKRANWFDKTCQCLFVGYFAWFGIGSTIYTGIMTDLTKSIITKHLLGTAIAASAATPIALGVITVLAFIGIIPFVAKNITILQQLLINQRHKFIASCKSKWQQKISSRSSTQEEQLLPTEPISFWEKAGNKAGIAVTNITKLAKGLKQLATEVVFSANAFNNSAIVLAGVMGVLGLWSAAAIVGIPALVVSFAASTVARRDDETKIKLQEKIETSTEQITTSLSGKFIPSGADLALDPESLPIITRRSRPSLLFNRKGRYDRLFPTPDSLQSAAASPRSRRSPIFDQHEKNRTSFLRGYRKNRNPESLSRSASPILT
jgi:hypothetical protein